jgi:hypothetical protein
MQDGDHGNVMYSLYVQDEEDENEEDGLMVHSSERECEGCV